MKIKMGKDLVPGDVILMGDSGRRNVRTTVLRTGEKAPEDLFGRALDAVWARREDTGAEGYVPFGTDGKFVLAEPGDGS